MTDQEYLKKIDQIVDDLLDNRIELSNFVDEHLLQDERVEEQQKGIEQLNNFIQFQRGVLDETKMELKGAKEDYSRLLKTAEEITEQHRQEIEKLKKDLQLQKEAIAGWAKQYQHSQEKFDVIRGLINDTELGLGDDCTIDCEEAIEQIQKVLEVEGKGSVYHQPPST
ncbi:hypothetical protein [Bacillus chungangensis]|uniref:RNase H-like nuclease (RuvC/YqgF family) n=1 Tax=Bacillus chungangensis TaxID=587633 RepID=A0ABT9WS90_9BACI|nr:hypothetical protein [Bacillus chungangensis]MDQ0176013.1 putative RNase H-like nuclease (RuvC/YqgF family) [Bacillus chungangensis]